MINEYGQMELDGGDYLDNDWVRWSRRFREEYRSILDDYFDDEHVEKEPWDAEWKEQHTTWDIDWDNVTTWY